MSINNRLEALCTGGGARWGGRAGAEERSVYT